MISRQAELVCQQAAQTLLSTVDLSPAAQVSNDSAGSYRTARQSPVQGNEDAAAEAAAYAKLKQLAAQGIEGAKEALDALGAQAESAAVQPVVASVESTAVDSSGLEAPDEDADAPYESSDEDDETIRKRISTCPSFAQSSAAYSSSGELQRLGSS